ncbi:MAG: TrbG/VirB9 family P-type conjugative transfer protein [Hyphomonadaceae bacterium]|nr:TrbG/VirB9 family P-type conjugative transfer protein [Hyphomonadaceae bacterium]
MKRLTASLLASCVLAACATTDIAPVAEGDGVETAASEDLRGMLEAEAAPAPVTPPPRQRRGREPAPLQVLANANTAARQRPTPDAFNQARHVFTYQSGALYELHTNPNYVSTVLLEPGETLSDIAAGDTARWMVTEATGEADTEARTIVLVKPQAVGLRTNIVLITDRRTYLIEAVSQAGSAYAAQVAWSYPQNVSASANVPSIDRLNFAYRVRTVRGRAPVWTPARVFDDGRRTWVEFPAGVAAADMPPLFIITGEGAEITNYRVQGRRMIVDRIFDRAELRLGVRAPVIVRIDREGARR